MKRELDWLVMIQELHACCVFSFKSYFSKTFLKCQLTVFSPLYWMGFDFRTFLNNWQNIQKHIIFNKWSSKRDFYCIVDVFIVVWKTFWSNSEHIAMHMVCSLCFKQRNWEHTVEWPRLPSIKKMWPVSILRTKQTSHKLSYKLKLYCYTFKSRSSIIFLNNFDPEILWLN